VRTGEKKNSIAIDARNVLPLPIGFVFNAIGWIVLRGVFHMKPDVELIPGDTSLEAFRVELSILRRLSAGRRLKMACRMTDSLRNVVASGVRSRHPEYTERQVKLATIRLTLGDELFREVYRGMDVPC
jgi:hypothetical protein